MKAAAASRMRLTGMIRKESLQILRDPSSIAIAFVMPVVLLLLFGYGVSLDARHIPLAMVVEQPDTNSASLVGAFRHSEYFDPQPFENIQAAQQAFDLRKVFGIVWLRNDFSKRLLSQGDAPIGVIVNGVDANQARITIGAMLTSMVVAREWERGTMEALMVTPIRIGELVAGKLIPYFVLGMGGMLLSVAMALWLFDVPLRGSFWALTAASALFMLVALGMGLLISVVAKNQFVAGQISIIITFLPAFILSGFIFQISSMGFIFQISSMPAAIQVITHIIPARYYVAILQTLFLAGDIWPIILSNSAALAVMMVIFLGLARRKMQKRLDA